MTWLWLPESRAWWKAFVDLCIAEYSAYQHIFHHGCMYIQALLAFETCGSVAWFVGLIGISVSMRWASVLSSSKHNSSKGLRVPRRGVQNIHGNHYCVGISYTIIHIGVAHLPIHPNNLEAVESSKTLFMHLDLICNPNVKQHQSFLFGQQQSWSSAQTPLQPPQIATKQIFGFTAPAFLLSTLTDVIYHPPKSFTSIFNSAIVCCTRGPRSCQHFDSTESCMWDLLCTDN